VFDGRPHQSVSLAAAAGVLLSAYEAARGLRRHGLQHEAYLDFVFLPDKSGVLSQSGDPCL